MTEQSGAATERPLVWAYWPAESAFVRTAQTDSSSAACYTVHEIYVKKVMSEGSLFKQLLYLHDEDADDLCVERSDLIMIADEEARVLDDAPTLKKRNRRRGARGTGHFIQMAKRQRVRRSTSYVNVGIGHNTGIAHMNINGTSSFTFGPAGLGVASDGNATVIGSGTAVVRGHARAARCYSESD